MFINDCYTDHGYLSTVQFNVQKIVITLKKALIHV